MTSVSTREARKLEKSTKKLESSKVPGMSLVEESHCYGNIKHFNFTIFLCSYVYNKSRARVFTGGKKCRGRGKTRAAGEGFTTPEAFLSAGKHEVRGIYYAYYILLPLFQRRNERFPLSKSSNLSVSEKCWARMQVERQGKEPSAVSKFEFWNM